MSARSVCWGVMTGSAKKTFKKGDTLIREGEQGDCAYVLESGRVEILVEREGVMIQIGTRGAGSIVGEMAMIDDKPRTATVRALEDCQALEISREDFTHSIDSADPILKMMMRVILTRYRDMLTHSQFIQTSPHFAKTEEAENRNEDHDRAVNVLKINHELQGALDKGELMLFYQPIIDLQNMKISGFEALMRWKHPEKGMIPPSVFIPVAEESGLIVDLSRWALETACDAVKKMHQTADKKLLAKDPLFVSVNFSVKDFSSGEFFNHIESTLDSKQVDPAHIHLEITESLLMETPANAKEALEKCRQKGLHISIDDFGTGYSSLSYLHNFPVGTLKIDQSFVRSMNLQKANFSLVKSIIGLAHNLDMKVIAEGIETEDDASTLKKLGCEECQGYWFAKPMPLEDALVFLKIWNPKKLR